MEDGADKVYLIEKFLGKVTNSNVRKGWAKTHLGAEKASTPSPLWYQPTTDRFRSFRTTKYRHT
jgi:hypothetical protein